ncbi:PAS domain S-box protein [Cyanobacteria bacterium FACHB-471]|nr:PAS domain S-box protein [Cyanobacteria bacterium FACHB-471]
MLMLDLLKELFSSGSFIPHGHCFLWRPGLVWLHIVSDTTIALAYYSISLTLASFIQRRKDLPFNWVFILFAAFITACGTSHLMSVWTLWHPTYWLSGGVKAITAVVSLSTAIALFSLVPKALAIPSSLDLEVANWALQQEIIERQKVERELTYTKDLREAVFNESADALFLVDPQTLHTVDCNRRAVELFQATDKAELIGIEGHTLQRYQFSTDELEAIVSQIQSAGFWSQELEYVTCKGNFFWGNIAAKPIAVAERTFNLVRVTDITERKHIEAEREQAEQALKISGARYRGIVEDQTELIARFLANGDIVFVNESYCRYFGVQSEKVIGRSYEPVIFEEDREAVVQLIASISPENPVVMIENRVVIDGEIRWTQWNNRMLFDEQGKFVEFQSVGRDVTNLKHTEERLQASLKEKEVLLKEIHHRVKNNLQIVYSLLRLQRRKLKDQLAANALLESQSRIESIALIHEKLYQSEDLSHINLAEYIPSLVTNLFSTYNLSHTQIALRTEIEPIFLDIDKAIRCGLIINELLSNSLKYAFPDRNQNNLSIHLQLFTISTGAEKSTIQLNMKDNGVGIPDHIDFSRPETLGLQLVQGFVGQLKGTLEMQRQGGTEFRVLFPG